MTDLLSTFGLSQYIETSTHSHGHTIDWLISRTEKTIVTECVVDKFVSDHCAIKAYLRIKKPKYNRKTIAYRKINKIDINAFKSDIEQSELIKKPCSDLNGLVHQYNKVLLELIKKHAPLKIRQVTDRPKASV